MRRGDMQLDGQGQLVSEHGFPILGDGGAIYLDNENVEISEAGVITIDDAPAGRLSIALFDAESRLIYEGGGLYRSDRPHIEDSDEQVQIKQGFLEASNVKPAQQMVSMIETTRHFALTQQALRGHDEMLDIAINTLGNQGR